MRMRRLRFVVRQAQPAKRPPGPYWCVGYKGDAAIVEAYVQHAEQITECWPQAFLIDPTPRNAEPIRPAWWAT